MLWHELCSCHCMQRETGWETMWEDQDTGRDAFGVPGQRMFRCPRLNRQLQSAYRRFRVTPANNDLDDIGMQAADSDDLEQRDVGSELPPASEVEVEATALYHDAESLGDNGERPYPDKLEPAPLVSEWPAPEYSTAARPEPAPLADEMEPVSPMMADQVESVRPDDGPRVGLRAIFATESDDIDEMPYETASAEIGDRRDDYSSAAVQEPGGIDTDTSPRESPPAQPQANSLVWKSFPKPLQRK